MPVKPPTIEELRRIAEEYCMTPSQDDLESYLGLIRPMLESYDRLDRLTEPGLPAPRPRSPGYRPAPEDNPLGAWYWRCDIRGEPGGILAGKSVAIKDNVCVAGVPMMNGAAVLEGYTPEVDATIVTRILEAGGNIAGKAVCESLCFSGGSHTSDTGPVRNPVSLRHSAGGSSSGSAALVAAGEVDMAIGGDQGGSIRIPASWCGIVGLKPTYGLVPYTGVFPIELTLDHTGPMARSTADVALLLEAIAGPDGLDPRQGAGIPVEAYSRALTGDVAGIRLGILQEGFGHEDLSERDVDDAVTVAARSFEELGAVVETVSVPWHREGFHVWNAIAVEGATMLMVAGNGMGTNWKGHYTTSLLDVYARGRRTRANDLSETTKLVTLLGQYMQDRYHGRYYAKAQNLARAVEGRLRRRPGPVRPAGYAHPADEGHGDSRAGLQPSGIYGQGVGDDSQHLPLRRDRASRHHRSLRRFRGPSHRHDAGGPRRRGRRGSPGGRRLREGRRRLESGGPAFAHFQLQGDLGQGQGAVVGDGEGEVYRSPLAQDFPDGGVGLIGYRLVAYHLVDESGDGGFVSAETFGGLVGADALNGGVADPGAGGGYGVAGPLDVAVPFPRRQDDGKLLQVFGHGALEAQGGSHGGQVSGGFGVVQQGAELEAHLVGVAVSADGVVDFLSFGVQFFTGYIRHTGGHVGLPPVVWRDGLRDGIVRRGGPLVHRRGWDAPVVLEWAARHFCGGWG